MSLSLDRPGNVVVDGVAASSYIDLLGSEAAMHAATAVGRWVYRACPSLASYLHNARLASPLSLALGNFLHKVRAEFERSADCVPARRDPSTAAMTVGTVTRISTRHAAARCVS